MTRTEWTAPEGACWICGACGRYGKQRDRIGDASCFLNAVLVKGDAPIFDRRADEEGVSQTILLNDVVEVPV